MKNYLSNPKKILKILNCLINKKHGEVGFKLRGYVTTFIESNEFATVIPSTHFDGIRLSNLMLYDVSKHELPIDVVENMVLNYEEFVSKDSLIISTVYNKPENISYLYEAFLVIIDNEIKYFNTFKFNRNRVKSHTVIEKESLNQKQIKQTIMESLLDYK